MNASPNGKMISTTFTGINQKDGAVRVQAKTSSSMGLRGKVDRNSTFRLVGFTHDSYINNSSTCRLYKLSY